MIPALDKLQGLWARSDDENVLRCRNELLVASAEVEEGINAQYRERAILLKVVAKNYPSCITIDAMASHEWQNVLIIDFGNFQGSWHISLDDLWMFDSLPRDTMRWDGHSTEEKLKNLESL